MAGMNGDRFNDRDAGHDRRDRHRDDRRGGDRDRDRDRGDRDRRDRRRSRSPRDRNRGARRGDDDQYAGSRYDMNREREDRYRRDDRGYDRERGGGGGGDRDGGRGGGDRRRRDFDDRRGGGRGDRDLFDGDRRGGRGGDNRRGGEGGGREDRRDRDEFAAQMRNKGKSPSPPPKRREPTPDLTDAVSVLVRKRRLTQWDIKPPGYEQVTAEQAKLSGMFPLPGAPRQQVMDPSKLQSMIAASGGGAEKQALKPESSRQAKRLVVSNLPATASDESVIGFFNLQMNGLNVVESTDPCISCQFSSDRGYAMVEFKSPSDATLALALDGQSMDDSTGLVIRRPKDYIVAAISDEEQQPSADGIVSTSVPDTANKISVSNILPNLLEDQVQDLLKSFGALRSFVLVRERGNDAESRGIAFCEYVDPSVTDVAIEGLNGMELGPQKLRVAKASIGSAQAATMEMSVASMSLLAGTTSEGLDEGRVLQLLNMVTPEELIDNQDYEEIVEDVQEECAKFGRVLDIKVPRPSMGSRQSSGVGKIFLKYDSPESARKAMAALAGRKFADRTVVVTYFSEENFETNTW